MIWLAQHNRVLPWMRSSSHEFAASWTLVWDGVAQSSVQLLPGSCRRGGSTLLSIAGAWGSSSFFSPFMCPRQFLSNSFPQHFLSTGNHSTGCGSHLVWLCVHFGLWCNRALSQMGQQNNSVQHMGTTSSFRGVFHPSCFLVHREKESQGTDQFSWCSLWKSLH